MQHRGWNCLDDKLGGYDTTSDKKYVVVLKNAMGIFDCDTSGRVPLQRETSFLLYNIHFFAGITA